MLKQDRARATRGRLLEAATALIREQGFEATKVSDIAERAGVAEGTFFFHFPRKRDILLELGLRTSEQAAATAPVRSDEAAIDALERFAVSVSRRIESVPRDLVVDIVSELYRQTDRWSEVRVGRSDFQAVFRAIYEVAVERGEVAPSVDLEEVSTLLSGAFLHAILLWAQGQRAGQSLASLLKGRVAIVHAGILATAT